jgi:cytochrome P450
MWDRFAPRLRKTIFAALEQAGRCGQEGAWAEHLLLALTLDEHSAATFMLRRGGIDPAALRAAIELQVPRAEPLPRRAQSLSILALHVLDVATGEAHQLGDAHVGTEHLLLAMTQLDRGPVVEALRRFDYTRDVALESRKAWIASGLATQRIGPRPTPEPRPRIVDAVLRPVEKTVRLAKLAYGVYVGLSLGHPKFASDPYPLYAKLRRHDPVRRDPLAPVWVVTRYDDVVTTLRDPRFAKDPFLSDSLPDRVREQLQMPPQRDAAVEGEPMAMLFLDPPRHTKIRSLFNKGFSSRALQLLRPRIQQITDKRLDRAASSGSMDVIADLAVPLPVAVIAQLLGFPSEDFDKLKRWSDDFAAALTVNPTIEQQAASDRSREEMREYFDQVVEQLKRKPGENLISTLLAEGVEREGSTDARLTRREFFANCALLLAAGHETTTNLIGNGVLALLRHPDQLRDLQQHPELIVDAIEELLRYDSPVQWTSRVAAEDVELGGKTIRRGDVVLGSLGSANRDERQFDRADVLNFRRSDNKHIAFGHGIHYCVGAALARIEAQIAIGTLVQRFPKLRLATRRVRWQPNMIFRGVKALPVELR